MREDETSQPTGDGQIDHDNDQNVHGHETRQKNKRTPGRSLSIWQGSIDGDDRPFGPVVMSST